jgi:hypothetical protein
MRPQSFLAITLVVLSLATGCMNNGIEWSELSFTRHRPADQDIAGDWTPTDKSLHKILKMNGCSPPVPEILLRTDGTFSVTNMPQSSYDESGRPRVQFVSGYGKWTITEDKDVVTVYMLELAFPDTRRHIHIAKQRAPYRLHITLGDPDSGNYLLFERTNLI